MISREEKIRRRRFQSRNETRKSTRGKDGKSDGQKNGGKKKNDRRNPCGEDELRTRGDREKWGFVTRGGN